MTGQNIRFVAFDLDGTLVDSAPDIAWAVQQMSHAVGLPPPDIEQVRGWVGDGVSRLVKRTLTNSRDGEPAHALFERGLEAFRQAYRVHLAVDTHLYPGAREVLAQLRHDGIALACITNKAAEFTEPLLAAFELRTFFDVVVSGDTTPERKPSPLPLLHAVKQLGLTPGQSCMVGDSANDMLAARAAGLKAIGVRFGYGSDTQLEPVPDAMLDTLADLPDVLENWRSGVVPV